uniref:Protein phosphatase 1 regulatory subunit 37 n=1 Tax=Sinocyclocheilus rhinocerous TaxID=307959 RepID=A0A673M775_9TELE
MWLLPDQEDKRAEIVNSVGLGLVLVYPVLYENLSWQMCLVERVTKIVNSGISILIVFPGERLDYCSCESLEEILKSVQFDFISLQGAELEQNGASSLLDMFLYYESATHLDMSSNSGMGFSGWLSLSHLLRQSGCLWRLDACNMPMVDYAAQALSKALLTSRLTVLHLENTYLSGKPLFTLVGALKRNVALQELYLSENNLNGYQDSMQLGDLLKYNSTLKTLDLSNNTILIFEWVCSCRINCGLHIVVNTMIFTQYVTFSVIYSFLFYLSVALIKDEQRHCMWPLLVFGEEVPKLSTRQLLDISLFFFFVVYGRF